LRLSYPKGVFSLSHVALPFPLTDSLYGLTPDSSPEFGMHLGALPLRGERGTLIVSLDALLRMSSNPFFPYLAERIEERLPAAPTVEHSAVIPDSADSPVQRAEQRALSSGPSQRPPLPASRGSSQAAPRRPR